MTEKQYLKAVSAALRRSGMAGKTRKRLIADLTSDFSARLERGESAGEIIGSMGPPEQLAEEFLAENGGASVRTRPQKILFFFGVLSAVLTAVCGFRLAAGLNVWGKFRLWRESRNAAASSVGIIGGADGPTSILIQSSPGPWTYLSFGLFAAACAACFFLYARSRRGLRK